jgi:hypothetical protein
VFGGFENGSVRFIAGRTEGHSPHDADPETIRARIAAMGRSVTGGTDRRLIVCDLDDVLVPISPKLAALAVIAHGLDTSLADPDRVAARETFQVGEYLGGLSWDDMKEFYRGDFYSDLRPTTLGRGVAAAAARGAIRLAIVSHTTDETRESKLRFCQRFFPGVTVLTPPIGSPKSEAINEAGLGDYSTFADDHPENVHDVAANTFSVGKEFMMPSYGYNRELRDETQEILLANRAVLVRYSTVF